MRLILVRGLVLMLAVVPAAQAQQYVPPVEAEPGQSSLTEVPPHFSAADSARVQPVEAYSISETAEAPEMRELSARTLLAVVGAVVVVVAAGGAPEMTPKFGFAASRAVQHARRHVTAGRSP